LVPAWSPDGKRLAYSRQSAGLTPGGPLGPPRVWILELSNDQTGQLYENDQVLGWGPTWSPDGNWIAAYDGTSTRIRVLNVQTKKEILLPSLMGTTGSWSPDGNRMLYNDLKIAGEQTHATLYLADFATEEISPAFADDPADVNYGIPNWSLDGAWVVTGIKRADQGLGSQLWIMRPDGGEARPITNDLAYTFGGYSWDPSGELVVFQRFELGVPFAKPEVMVWSFATGQITPIVQDASLPGWLP
jgi:TolB protein